MTRSHSGSERTWSYSPPPVSFSPSPVKGPGAGSSERRSSPAAVASPDRTSISTPSRHSPAVLQCEGLAGVGMVLGQTGTEVCEVDSFINGASAQACGLIRPGDKLLAVNGRDVRSTCMQVRLLF